MKVVGHAVSTQIRPAANPKDAKARRTQSDAAILAVQATRDVLARVRHPAPADIAHFMGVGASGGRETDLAHLLTHGLHRANPLLAFQLMNNFALCHAAIDAGLGGPSSALYSTGAGTVFALIQALAADATFAIVGGTDCPQNPVTRHNQRARGLPDLGPQAAAVLALSTDGEGPEILEAKFIGRADPPAFASDWIGHRDGSSLAADAALGWVEALDAIAQGAQQATSLIRDRDGQCGWVTFGQGAAPRTRHPGPARVRSMGVVSAYGIGVEALREGITTGRCASRPVERFDTDGLGAGVAAMAPVLPGPRDRKVGLVLEAASQLAGVKPSAWIHLGVGLEWAHLEDFDGLVKGSTIHWDLAPEHEAFRTDLDAAAWALSDALGTHGPITIDVSACAAGGLSLLGAKRILELGLADQVVCGAVDAMVNPLGYGGMARLGAMSPDGVARPFDRRRNGLVMGEGCALFVMERGRGGLGTLLGAGASQDGFTVTAPRPDGAQAARAIERALRDAGIDSVSWVNAHGTGTPLNDPAERAALNLADVQAPVRSLKGGFGHAMAAAGALEAAASWLCLRDDTIPPTPGLQSLDPACAGPDERGTPGTVLSTSFGFGGQNVALILGRE